MHYSNTIYFRLEIHNKCMKNIFFPYFVFNIFFEATYCCMIQRHYKGSADGVTVFDIWQFGSRKCKQLIWNYILSSMHKFYFKYLDCMCQGGDSVIYDVYVMIQWFFRNKYFYYQVEVAGKSYFLKNLSKIKNHLQPYLKLGLYNCVIRIS